MASGLPVVVSDFPLWKRIIEEARCGLLVNPLNPNDIANAIKWLFENPDEASAMGQRGRDAVDKKFNWENEFEKMTNVYHEILNSK